MSMPDTDSLNIFVDEAGDPGEQGAAVLCIGSLHGGAHAGDADPTAVLAAEVAEARGLIETHGWWRWR